MIYFIYIRHIDLFHGNIWAHDWPAANISGFIAQLVRALHQYFEITGSRPIEVLIFFSGFLCSCINFVHNYEDHSFLLSLPQMLYDLFHIHLTHSYTHLFHRNIWTHNWPAPNINGFTAQLARASPWYHGVTGWNHVKSWIFFRPLTQMHKLRSQLRRSFFICFHFCSS